MNRSRSPILLFAALFLVCVLGSYAWFNVGLPSSSLRSPASGIWLEAKTNIPGYIFVEEPVSEEVKKTLGTTNILSGSFYKVGDRSLEIRDRETAINRERSALDTRRSTVPLASDLRPPSSGLQPPASETALDTRTLDSHTDLRTSDH